MRVAVLSDTHGNLLALEAVLEAIEQDSPDLVVMAGDAAFGGPWPAECIDFLRQRGIPAVRGNTDEFLVAVATGRPPATPVEDPRLDHLASSALAARYAWCVERLRSEQIDYLASLPLRFVVPAPTGAALVIVHATPSSPHPVVPPDAPSERLRALLDESGGAALTYGHIHQQARWQIGSRLVVAVGSVGLPFDGDQRAAYALLEWNGTSWSARFQRVPYPVERTIQALEHSGMPGAETQIRVLQTARPPGA
jgi:predicted phosphodiesterase